MTSHVFLFFEAKIIQLIIKFSDTICKLRMHRMRHEQAPELKNLSCRYIHVLYYLYYKNRAYLIIISS